jgi:antitoxin (DNA-binding transcriptional repressor) of toxin-antitoxin stability system
VKTVTVEEFRAHIDQYLAETAQGEVLLTQDGKPWVILRAAGQELDDDSSAFAKSPEFWRMIAERRREQGIPWEEAQKLLDLE